ncbi:YicC/YloC family endoribonuclease, partial [Klebsiella aerogenes]|uniref:YicC/YloC family endoribonuclease n=1 Tax=Klebsiella aerogenes TaxID=548 RepID=UPI0034D78B6F
MTGYGRAEQMIGGKQFLIEIRSLNGKQFDLRLNIPALLKPFEFEIRNNLNEGLLRGSVE